MNESVEQSDPLAHSLNTFIGTEQSCALIQVYMVYSSNHGSYIR